MVRYTLPISDVSSIIIWGFHAICPATEVLELEWLLQANDLANSSEQHELPVSEVLPDFPGALYEERFFDRPGADGFTTLSFRIFWWLINICPRYLIFRQGNICRIEPYLPNWYAGQFGYDQLYVGNSNVSLHLSGNLYEGSRVWYFNVAGGTEVRFNLPQKIPNS